MSLVVDPKPWKLLQLYVNGKCFPRWHIDSVTDMFLFPVVVGHLFLLRNYQRARDYPLSPVAVGCPFQTNNHERWGCVPPVAAGHSLQMSNEQRTQKYVNSVITPGHQCVQNYMQRNGIFVLWPSTLSPESIYQRDVSSI